MAITTKAALADELGITRARVSQYVKAGLPVRSDGRLNRDDALNWIKRNQVGNTGSNKGANRARRIVREVPPQPPVQRLTRVRSGDIYLDDVVPGRLSDWREIYGPTAPDVGPVEIDFTIERVAEMHGIRASDVLAWLRAGCPYAREGDWETGEGFLLRFAWAAEWAGFVHIRTEVAERYDLQRALGMDRGAFARREAA